MSSHLRKHGPPVAKEGKQRMKVGVPMSSHRRKPEPREERVVRLVTEE
jgi:hypothetical protein